MIVCKGSYIEAETLDIVQNFGRCAEIASAVVLGTVGFVVVNSRLEIEETHVSLFDFRGNLGKTGIFFGQTPLNKHVAGCCE